MSLSIILVRPQMGENIGATARAMANFGVRDLRLVAPRDGWPNPKASDMAGKALDIIDDAKLFDATAAAVADKQFVLATTSRARAMNLPVLEVRAAMEEVRTRLARGEQCAVMFGPERTGLENEDVTIADAVVTIPVSPDYPSLNVAQAVVVACYEWWVSGLASDREADLGEPAAPRTELAGLCDQMEAALEAVNFWRVPEKRDGMWRNIRAVLVRARLSSQEVATWRGIIRALRQE